MPPTLTPARAAVCAKVITAIAGPNATLRDDQTAAVSALCEPAARVLVVQATGWGKSAVYWAATAIRRACVHRVRCEAATAPTCDDTIESRLA